jgi:DNA repair exonuclease SbcCD ATPase subunit
MFHNKTLAPIIQRIINVLDELLEDLQNIQHIPVMTSQYTSTVQSSFSQDVQQEIAELFEEEKILEQKFKEKNSVNELLEFADPVKHTTKRITMLMRQTGFQKKNLRREKESHNNKMGRLIQRLSDMREVWCDKLNTTVEEEQIRAEQRSETAARDKKASADVKALQRELASERSIREKEVSLREDAIKKLQDELYYLQTSSKNEKQDFDTLYLEKEDTAQKKYIKFDALLKDQIEKTKEKLKQVKTEHEKLEKEMILQRKGEEKQVEGIVANYDKTMSETSIKINGLMRDFEKDEKRVNYLQAELKKFEEEKAQKAEELRKIMEEKKSIEERRKKKNTAASVIGRAWRSHKHQQEEAKKAAKKKPKKGGAKSPKRGKSPAKGKK